MRFSSFGGDGPADAPSAEFLEAWRRRTSAPENEVPTAVPVSEVLAATDDVAVALVGVLAYTTGWTFNLAVRLRTEPRGRLRHQVFGLMGGAHFGDTGTEERLLLGVEYADGRMATNLDRGWLPDGNTAEPDPEDLVLMPGGGGGGGRTYDHAVWMSPLPPDGPLVVVTAWEAFAMGETRIVLDGSAIGEAGRNARVLWPWEPEDEQPEDFDEAPVPSTGWFAKAVRGTDDIRT